MPDVNPIILVWARETAGLSLEDAVKKLGINSNKKMAAVEKLIAFEKGVLSPSRPMLLKMSQQYRRPLVAFYMKDVPVQGTRPEDFRNVPDRDPTSDTLISVLVRNPPSHLRRNTLRYCALRSYPGLRCAPSGLQSTA